LSSRHKFEFSASLYPDLPYRLRQHIDFKQEYGTVLDSNSFTADKYSRFDWLAGWGSVKAISSENKNLDQLYDFHSEHQDWLFGHLNYNLKNQLEKLRTSHVDELAYPLFHFFIPETIIYCKSSTITVESYTLSSLEELISEISTATKSSKPSSTIKLSSRTSKEDYIKAVNRLKEELQFGNIYEINYCIEFWAKQNINPSLVFEKLNELSQAPFSAFYKLKDNYLLCASPERYLQKNGSKVISQPIKGTARRSVDTEEDRLLAQNLSLDEKERSENVMIVDLVRNDLSRTAQKNSVTVEELYGVYTFKNVHQLVSTVSSNLKPNFTFTDLLKTSFPMGSMTGAPKIKAMELIDQFENFNRSLYSGSVGYIDPDGNLDFNVVIRSLFYNQSKHYLSARVGSAITIHASAEKEYEECLVKASSLFECLR